MSPTVSMLRHRCSFAHVFAPDVLGQALHGQLMQ